MRTGAVVALILLAAVLAGGLAGESAVKANVQRYISAAAELRAMIDAGQWQRADETLHAYRADWEKSAAWMRLILQHDGLNAIANGLDNLAIGVDLQDQLQCAVSCEELRRSAERLIERETFSWANLL